MPRHRITDVTINITRNHRLIQVVLGRLFHSAITAWIIKGAHPRVRRRGSGWSALVSVIFTFFTFLRRVRADAQEHVLPPQVTEQLESDTHVYL